MTSGFISDLTKDFQGAAEAAAAAKKNGTPAAGGQEKTDGKKEAPAPPAGGQPPADDGMKLSEAIKKQLGIDLSDDEIKARLSGGQQAPAAAERGGQPRKKPTLEDVTDDEVSEFLEKNQKPKDTLARIKTRKEKKDQELVQEYHVAMIRQAQPKLSQDQAEAIFRHRFHIAAEGEDPYTDEEVAVGKFEIEQMAKILRETDVPLVNNARNAILNQKLQEFENAEAEEAFNAFSANIPKSYKVQLGKHNEIDYGEYDYPLPEKVIQSVVEQMKDPNQFKALILNDKGQVDNQKLFNLLLRNAILDDIQSGVAIRAYSDGVESIRQQLAMGVDLANVGNKGGKVALTEEQKKQQEQAKDHNTNAINKATGGRRTK